MKISGSGKRRKGRRCFMCLSRAAEEQWIALLTREYVCSRKCLFYYCMGTDLV